MSFWAGEPHRRHLPVNVRDGDDRSAGEQGLSDGHAGSIRSRPAHLVEAVGATADVDVPPGEHHCPPPSLIPRLPGTIYYFVASIPQ